MLISFGILSPPLGAPFSIYPLIVSFVMGVRTGSKTEAVIWGSALTAIFLPIGGWLGFLLSRHVLMDWATRLSAKFPTLEALHSVFSQPSQSLKIMILLRLSPVLPSSILNYVLGTFPVRNREFLLSYFFSAVFWGIPLSMVGSVFTNMSDMEEGNDTTDPSTPIGLTIIVLGVGATVGVTLAITHYTRKKLREIIEAEEAKAEEANADGEITGEAGGGAKVSAITTISEEEVGVELT
ncbi:hypothetical protein TrVE_jg8952 [Triparma verrucosa]|uniref:VTT domain-containing protein n=1 Tax=Triparma verrucosa TaxID=1606542 RepID=A0A9W6Z5U0_9STRA|nr:hypothetical protein TrVE_jg8952 [Triparma verrucosa]